ncbi:obscurin-like [Hyalella azteca]|uniref:Obscurin-like n=1 Tax=Hyalella azteca TaxID=294128 RepID=A0A8B7NI66_HYAAZ|nr:obscurin-like [Hyalella azteca]
MGKLVCECISKKARRPVGDEYQGWDKMKRTGIPVPLPDRPYISALSDRRVTVSWNPYIAQGPQPPVTYQVEMCESPEGDWFTARSGIRGTAVDITNLAPKTPVSYTHLAALRYSRLRQYFLLELAAPGLQVPIFLIR